MKFFTKQRRKIFTIILIMISITVNAQTHEYIQPKDSLVLAKLSQWKDWKFGVLIHWGAYSQWGIVESWSLCPEDEGWCERRGPYANNYFEYKKAYENIRREFNPQNFDPKKWADAFKDAGMKYVVFTTKHHDGFCMYDSKYTNYKITDTASAFSKNPKSNVAKEVFNAFRSDGFGIGAYFSKPDWHSENYWWPYFPPFDRNVNYDPKKYPERWRTFQDYTYNQIEELMTGYGKFDLIWLDGGWVRPASTLNKETTEWLGKRKFIQDVNMPRIAAMARSHQPGLLVVDRSVHGEYENYQTPEQQVPEKLLNYPWESCITLGPGWYSASPDEKYKTVRQAIQLLINIVSKGGNLLLGIGPDKTGDLVPTVYERLKGIGEWMRINGEGIYGTVTNDVYESGDWRFTRSKDGKIVYAFYLLSEANENALTRLVLPAIHPAVKSKIYLLGYNKSLKWKTGQDGINILIPKELTKKLKDQPALTFKIQTSK
jgi:alpha-L-fucosidase